MEFVDYFKTSSPDFYPYLEEQAKRIRHNQTLAESALWQSSRGKALGVKFRRQHLIGDYIADFACLTSKLIIEVDGGYHFTPEQQRLDALRTEAFVRMGFREIRFTNDEILTDIESVVQTIKSNL